MPGLYANKFTVEKNDFARIVMVDECVPLKGLPSAASTAAEIVMTHENALALGEMLVKIFKE